MKNEKLLWLLMGIGIAVIGFAAFNNFARKPVDEPLQSGTISYEYHWLPSDTSRAETEVKSVGNAAVEFGGLREYEILARNENFTVRLSVVGREVQSARIQEAHFQGQTQVTVYRDRVVIVPQTRGLTATYTPQADFHAPREKWVEAEILVGAQVTPPYSPIIACGLGIRRLPLIGKLPPVTLGAGWFGQGVGCYLAYRF